MKTLLLLRHAKSSWKDEGLTDHDRPLNKRGKKAAPLMGHLARDQGLVPDLILSSTAVRARKTAKAFAKAARCTDQVQLDEALYLATAGDLLATAQTSTPDDVARLMLVAHNPGMEDLVQVLTGHRERFPTAALAVFELGIDSWKELELGVDAKLRKIWRPKDME